MDVLRGVATAKGIESFFEMVEGVIRPEKIKFWRSILRSHYTFAKHADRDPHREIEDFNPESTNMVLFGAISDYGSIYKQLTLPMYMFRGWILARAPNILQEGELEKIVPQSERILGVGAPLHRVQALYREFKDNSSFYLSAIPNEKRGHIEL